MSLGWNYPAGLEHHPDAPWNQREDDDHPRSCRCEDCQNDRADAYCSEDF